MKKTMITILNIALALALVWLVINIFMPVTEDTIESDTSETVNKTEDDIPVMSVDKDGEQDIDKTALEKLFDSKVEKDSTPQETKVEVYKLPADTKLKGTVSGSIQIARAMFATRDDNGTPKVLSLKTGETLHGFVISEIKKDSVILNKGSQELTVWIASGSSDNNITGSSKDINAVTAENDTFELILPETKETLVKSLDSLKMDTEWEVVRNKNNQDEIVGLRLLNVKPLSPIALMGVKSNDIIMVINRQTLTGFKKAYQVLQKAKLQKRLDITVNRNGEVLNFDSEISN